MSLDRITSHPGRWFLALLMLFPALEVRAHGPFDHSSKLTVDDTRLELVVTIGGDAAVQFLTGCGLDPGLVTAVTRSSAARELPPGVASRLFEVKAGDKLLPAKKVTAFTEGLETLFIVVYPRPGEGTLDFRALYFNGIEPMKRGAFVAEDESMGTLGSALLSRENDSIRIQLPAKPVAVSQDAVTAEKIPSPQIVTNGSANVPALAILPSAPEDRFGKPGGRFGLCALAAALVVLCLVSWRRLRRG